MRSLTGSDLGLGIESIMSLVPGFDPRHRQILFVWNLSRARGGRCFGVGWGGGPWRIRSGQGKIRSNFHLLAEVSTIPVLEISWPGRIFCPTLEPGD